jgi:hypothetical protein
VAGNGFPGFGGDGGPATSAQMDAPNSAVMTADGSILIADSNNHRIRRVDPNGTMSTVAGSTAGFGGDGAPATSAFLSFPADLALLADGSYLIADNDNNRIRRVGTDGIINTVAGDGTPAFDGDDGPATLAQINDPTGVAATSDGGYLIADLNNRRIRRVGGDGIITTVAGTGSAGFSGDGGPATLAQLNAPDDLSNAADGSFFIADPVNDRIRRVAPDGTIATVAGTGTTTFNGDGGPGTSTNLNNPFDAAPNAEGDLLIADTSNDRIRLLDSGAPPPPLSPPPPPAPGSLTLDPPSADRRPGDANVVTATVRNTDGGIAVNRVIRWSIAGPNAESGTATTDAQGVARITWEGVREGTDTLSAYVDTNGDLTPGLGEPTAQATVTWTLPVPVQGRVYNIEPVSGIVKIRVVRRRGKGVHAAGASFQTLAEAQQVGFDTIVDVRKGRVRMTTASSRRAGDVQKGEFYGGVYTTTQPRSSSRPVTELRLSEGLICQRNRRGKVTSSRARSRRLWGNGRGRFRTRGRNSAATVRGTIWLTKDSCNATTTVVREGSVTVRDFAKRKNVTVRAPRRYTARRKR